MATSKFTTKQYDSSSFVESSGAIVFDFSQQPTTVCLIHVTKNNEWLLAKGRRNQGESRKIAALREAQEETGYTCNLYPVTMQTRAPPANETASIADQARTFPMLTEPFMVTTRTTLNNGGPPIKFIYWYTAEVDKEVERVKSEFDAVFFPLDKALEMLTYEDDRKVLGEAIRLVKTS